MPQSSSPFSSPGAGKAANVLSPFKNSQNAATLLGKGTPSASASPSGSGSGRKANLNNSFASPKGNAAHVKGSNASGGAAGGSGSGGNRSVSTSSSPYGQKIASLAAAATGHNVVESPLLPREQETTYHRKLRTLLQQYAAYAEAWEEVVTYDGLKWAKLALDAWGDLESARSLGKTTTAEGPRARQWKVRAEPGAPTAESALHQAHDPITGPGGVRERRMAEALLSIEKAEVGLKDVVARLEKQLAKIVQTSEAIAALLLDAAKTRGLEFAFQDPMWGTWPLERFVSQVTDLTPSYVLSTSHLALLVPVLLRPKPAPSSASSTPGRISKASFTSRADGGASGRQVRDPNAHRRRAYEDWIALPYLETKGRGSIAWLESVCQVEVARYQE